MKHSTDIQFNIGWRDSKAGILGIAASSLAILQSTLAELRGIGTLDELQSLLKMVVLSAAPIAYYEISRSVFARPRVAAGLVVSLILLTVIGMLVYLPRRNDLVAQLSSSSARWYYPGMPSDYPGIYPDYSDWISKWNAGIPVLFEISIIVFYYSIWVIACLFRKLSLWEGCMLGLAGYGFLIIAPFVTELVDWDYDVFLMGIVLDSVSFELISLWHTGPTSIYLYSFMLVFFICGTSTTMLFPRARR